MKATDIVISSNQPVRKDGTPYAVERLIKDPGVAVYFTLFGKQQCIPCDKWIKLEDNIHAVNKTVEALRGIERWGAKDMVQAAFSGFQALPDYTTPVDWFAGCDTDDQVEDRYKDLLFKLHPDHGGNTNDFQQMMQQHKKRIV